jgi:xanthine dehydrogenase accessory factor
MRDILPHIKTWHCRGDKIALATVTQTWGSSPRAPGSKMAVNQNGEMTGSVSGGCVEGAVVQESLHVLKTGRPKLLHFGVADETAWDVGLACGGSIEIFVEPLDWPQFTQFSEYVEQDKAAALATIIRGPDTIVGLKAVFADDTPPTGPLLDTPWQQQIVTDATQLLKQRAGGSRQYHEPEAIDLFFDVHRPASRLIIVGGVHIAVDLIHFAKPLGFSTYLADPRTAFASAERFPHADHIINQWPDDALPNIGLDGDTAVVVVTHDPKLDDPALKAALPSEAFYVGALGSPKTHAKRVARLLNEGVSPEHLERLHAPIGLNIGGRSPAEIALSIVAQIVAVRNGH